MKTIIKIIFYLSFCLTLSISKSYATEVEYLAVSKDKNLLALAYGDSVIRLYSLESGKLIKELITSDEADEYIEMMGFKNNGSQLAAIYSGKNTLLWDTKTGEHSTVTTDVALISELRNKPEINTLKKENWVISSDTLIKVMDTKSKKEKAYIRFKGLDLDEIKHVSFSNDGKSAAVTIELNSDDYQVVIIDTSSYAIKMIINPLSKGVADTQFLNDHLVLLNSVYPIEVWNINTKKKHFSFIKQGSNNALSLQDIAKMEFKAYTINSRINGLDVNSKTGNIIVTGTGNPIGAIEITPQGKIKQVFQNIYSTGYDARYSPDGKLAAFAFHGEHLLVFDVETNQLNKEYDLGGVPNGTRIIKYSRDSKYLAAGSDGNILSIIDLNAKSIIDNIKFPAGVFSIQWISDKKLLVGTLLELYELDLNSKEKRTILESPTIALDAFFNNDKLALIAVGRQDDDIVLFDSNYQQIKTFPLTGVGRIAFSKDGKRIIASSDDKTIIWDFAASKHKTCEEDDKLWAMSYDKNKQLIYTGGDNGKVHVWDINCKAQNN